MAEVSFQYDGKQLTYDPEKLSVLEGIELKKLTGYTYIEWAEEIQKFDPEAVRFIVWLALGRAGERPDVKYREFDFDMPSVLRTFESDEPEVQEADPTQPRPNRASRRKSSPTAR